jgi:perosamine synthetase
VTRLVAGSSAAAALAAIRQVIGDGPAALHAPVFGGDEQRNLAACIESTFVSTVGAFVSQFERDLAACTGARHVVAVASGTAALHAALVAVGVVPHDEVIVPSLTFAATAAAVVHAGAIPHFADSDTDTFGIDARALRAHLGANTVQRGGHCVNRRTQRVIRALVPMHVFGTVADMPELLEVAREFGLVVVEDAAEALGSTRDGRYAGTWGAAGVLSFNGNKIITTGGGGAILTDDPTLAARVRHLTTTARVAHPWEVLHDAVGWNYRMPNLNAAVGCAQLAQLDGFLSRKRVLHERYRAAFDGMSGVRLLTEPHGTRSNQWLQALLFDEAQGAERDGLLALATSEGVQLRAVWTPLHLLVPYRACPAMPLPVATSLGARLVNLPSGAGLVPAAAVRE